MTTQALHRRFKNIQDSLSEVHSIRLHRAISWLKAADEQEKNPDLRLISLWIACNCLYAMDDAQFESLQERERFADFSNRLLQADTEQRIFNLLWNKFSGPIRLLIENKYVYGPFWDFQRGKSRNWESSFKKSITEANNALASKQVHVLLYIVLDRLYTLRNQLIHGGATYKSKLNRAQLRDGANILHSLLPIMVDIMMTQPDLDWGKIYYPPV